MAGVSLVELRFYLMVKSITFYWVSNPQKTHFALKKASWQEGLFNNLWIDQFGL